MRLFGGFLTSRDDLVAEDRRAAVAHLGATPIGELAARQHALVAGQIVSLTFQPRGATPALTARLNDGSATIGLVFLGRTEVPGIEAGRRLTAEGVVGVENGLPVIYNPVYRLLPR